MSTIKKKHAKFSASSSHRWMHCPGSIGLIEQAPPSVETSYAEEGTKAHSYLEKLLTALKGSPVPEALFSNEMQKHAITAYEEIVSHFRPGVYLLCETKVSLEFIAPDMFGTVDAAIVDEFGILTVFDYKYGAGIPIDPEDNPQLIYYALGLAHKYNYNFSEVKIVIIQPRAEHHRGPVREWVTTIENLKEWGKKFKEAVKAANEIDAPLISGDHCRFCPAAAICPEISKRAIGKADGVFGPIEVENTETKLPSIAILQVLDDEKLGEILTGIDTLETWISSVRSYAFNRAQKGAYIPGWKLVEKRSTRKWIDIATTELEANAMFGDKAFTEPELLSPAQLEKLPNAKGFVEARVSSISSGVTLVPESDRRTPVSMGPSFPPLELETDQTGKEEDMATKKKTTTKKKTKTK